MRSAGSSVAVVGAGASGVLTALRLLELAGDRELEVLLVDPTAEPGRGIAYSTRESTHLLNVPAGRLSADASDPDHFARWASRRLDRSVGPDEFLPRQLLGSYLGDLLDAASERCRGARLRMVRERVTGVRNSATGVTLRLASGDTLSASAAVLAIGLS